MGQTTPNISIYIPAAGETGYDQSFASGMVNIDQHDHSGGPNKGVPLTGASLAAFSVTYDKLNSNVADNLTGIGTNATIGKQNQLQILGLLRSIFQLVAASGFISKDGTNAHARTLTGTANQITITNGDGVSGNPVFSLASTTVNAMQPAFSASVGSGTQSAKTGNGTAWLVRFNTVQFDQGSNFTTGSDPTGSLFTAPVTGVYLFTVELDMSYTTPAGLDDVQLEIVSAGIPGGANTIFDVDPFPILDPSNHTVINGTQIIKLTAAQTVQVRVTATGMAGDTASITGGFFTGALLC